MANYALLNGFMDMGLKWEYQGGESSIMPPSCHPWIKNHWWLSEEECTGQVHYKHHLISSFGVDLFLNWPRTHFVNLSAEIPQTMGFVKFFSEIKLHFQSYRVTPTLIQRKWVLTYAVLFLSWPLIYYLWIQNSELLSQHSSSSGHCL